MSTRKALHSGSWYSSSSEYLALIFRVFVQLTIADAIKKCFFDKLTHHTTLTLCMLYALCRVCVEVGARGVVI